MSNKKQTAVDWLEIVLIPDPISEEDFEHNINCWKQAKEMEKQQIIDARNDGFMASGEGWNGEYGIEDFNSLTKEIKSEQYYKEKYE
jgi:hypothetical protein